MIRVRWLKTRWKASMRKLADGMKLSLFTEDSSSGFILDRVRDDFVEGEYVEKSCFEETVTDPFGRSERLRRVCFSRTPFVINSSFPQIQVVNPARQLVAFTNKLAELNGFEAAIEPVVIDVEELVVRISERVGQQVRVQSVQGRGILGNSNATGTVLVQDGKSLFRAFAEVFGGNSTTIDSVKLGIGDRKLRKSVIVNRMGCLRLSGRDDPEFVNLVRSCIPDVVRD